MTAIPFGILGLVVLLAIAWFFSDAKKKVNWRIVGSGIVLQLLFAVFVILTPWGSLVFDAIGNFFVKIISFTNEGAAFVFGALSNQEKFGQAFPEMLQNESVGFIFAFQVLPTIIFFASLMSVLYHLGLMQKIVQGMGSCQRIYRSDRGSAGGTALRITHDTLRTSDVNGWRHGHHCRWCSRRLCEPAGRNGSRTASVLCQTSFIGKHNGCPGNDCYRENTGTGTGTIQNDGYSQSNR
jgi:hypothetical protein